MMDKFRENNILYKDREDLKKQMFVVFFGKLHAHRYDRVARMFREEFPNVQRVFDFIKKKQHSRLANLLTRIESHVILDRVACEINRQIPNLHILTKHDSILPVRLYVSGECERAREIMVDTIHRVTGIVPQGRMKKF